MGRLFLFKEVSPGETSLVTWGFEEAKVKVPPHRLPPRLDSLVNLLMIKYSPNMRTLSQTKTIAK
jgi:hypothetical protein